jgi:hypothetical protein
MKYIKLFENFPGCIDIKVSEADKIKSLPGFDFMRRRSDIIGYHLQGNRTEFGMEYIIINKTQKKDKVVFELLIRRFPGWFRDIKKSFWSEENVKSLEWEQRFNFDNIEELIKFLLSYEWYDIEQFKKPYMTD